MLKKKKPHRWPLALQLTLLLESHGTNLIGGKETLRCLCWYVLESRGGLAGCRGVGDQDDLALACVSWPHSV